VAADKAVARFNVERYADVPVERAAGNATTKSAR
jgi:hypothetical protein